MQFLRQNGDVYQSGGPRLVSYFGAIHHTHDDEVISAAKKKYATQSRRLSEDLASGLA
jgi:hypothetical protein